MKKNLKIIRGDDTSIALTIKQGEQMVDLSNIEKIDLHAKAKNKVVLTLSSDDGSIEKINNKIILNFAHHHTAKARWDFADYDVQIIKNSKIKTIMYGTIELQHDITEVSPI